MKDLNSATIQSQVSATDQDSGEVSLQFRQQIGHISRQSAVFFSGQVFTIVVGYIFKIYIARKIGASGLGLYALGLSVVNIFSVLVILGMRITTSRFVAIYHSSMQLDQLQSLLWRGLLRITVNGVLFALVIVLARAFIAESLFGEPKLSAYLPLFALMLLFNNITAFGGEVLGGYKEVALRTIVSNFVFLPLKIVVTVICLSYGLELFGYIVGEFIASAAVFSLTLFFVWKLTPVAARSPKKHMVKWEADVMRMARTSFGLSILGILSGQLDRIILGTSLDAEAVGIYSVAIATALYMPIFLQSINSIFGPIIAELYAQQKLPVLNQLFQTLTKWTIILSWPLFVTLVVFSRPLMEIFGEEFGAGSFLLRILVLGQFVNLATGSVGYLLLMSGNQRLELITLTISSCISALLLIVLVPIAGMEGAGLALTLNSLLANLIRLWLVFTRLNLWPYNRGYIRLVPAMLLSVVVSLLICLVFSWQSYLQLFGIFLGMMLSYGLFGLLVLMRGLDKNDLLVIDAARGKVRQVLRGITHG